MRVLVIYGRLLRDLYRRFFPTATSSSSSSVGGSPNTKVSRDNRLKIQRALRELKDEQAGKVAAGKVNVKGEGEGEKRPDDSSQTPAWQLKEQQMLESLRKARKGLDQQAAALELQRERNRQLMEFRKLAKGKARRESKMKEVLEEIEKLDKDYFSPVKPENKNS